MLIGCISGPDEESAYAQIAMANATCQGAELRTDLINRDLNLGQLLEKIEGVSIVTGEEPSLSLLEPDYLMVSWKNPFSSVSRKTKLIRAYHNFESTPENLEEIYNTRLPADLYKMVTMAHSTLDGLRMGIFSKGKKELIGFCMGEEGRATRILSPILNNPFNFVALEYPIAPGQLSAEELEEVYGYSRLTPSTSIYALIGDPVEQSPSHWTHNGFFRDHEIDAVYVKLLIQQGEVARFLGLAPKLGVEGVSVTCPHKETITTYVDQFEGDAKEIGAVNTLAFADGKVYGGNTDAKAALDAIEKRSPVEGKKVVILGAGGTARAIAYEAKKRKGEVTILNRSLERAQLLGEDFNLPYGLLTELEDYEICINTTSNPFPVDMEKVKEKTLLMDVGYHREKSPLVQRARELDCQIVLGEEMFRKQAVDQFARWFSTFIHN